jgi:hypothetical protein
MSDPGFVGPFCKADLTGGSIVPETQDGLRNISGLDLAQQLRGKVENGR